MTALGFLHTSAAHVPMFDALVGELDGDVRTVHVVAESLLADARAGADVSERLRDRLAGLAATPADRIVCTCSTIGGLAEDVGAVVPVLRVDRPMAEQAVAIGGRVAIVAALASTIGPTRTLLAQCAAAAGTTPQLLDRPCLSAWSHFESGDVAGYLRAIERHVAELVGSVDVVVLAQASMAPLAERSDLGVPVLASPRAAVHRVLRASP